MFVFSVYDKVAEVYGTPFFTRSKHEGVRCFVDVTCDSRSVINRHPEDYELRMLGKFDDRTGILCPDPDQCVLMDGCAALRRGSAVGGETPFKTQSDQPDCNGSVSSDMSSVVSDDANIALSKA